MKKRAILYTRVSTDEQASHGYSLRDQHHRLLSYCNIQGYEVIAHFQDDHSAKTFNRPEFQNLLKYLGQNKNAADLLLFVKWDRFSRNATESYDMLDKLKKHAIDAQAMEQPLNMDIPESKLMLAMYLATPEVENDRRSLNTIYGIRRANKEGRWCGVAPKGYSNKRDQLNKPIIVPNQDAKHIVKAFKMVSKGIFTVEHARKTLSDEGFYCSKSQFYTLLRNTLYMGKIKMKAFKNEPEKLVDGMHKPLISEEFFYQVQDVLDGRRKKSQRPVQHGTKTELPLRGFLQCPRCGKPLTGSGSKGNGGRYFYYHCTNGCKERVRASIVNDKFLDKLKEYQPREDFKTLYNAIFDDVWANSEADNEKLLAELNKKIKKTEQRIESLQEKFIDNLISSEDYQTMRSKLEKELRQLKGQKQNVSVLDKKLRSQLEYGFEFLQKLPQVFPKCPIDVQQQIIGSIFTEKIVFENNQVRTNKVNEVAALVGRINKASGRNKKGQFSKIEELSCLVAPRGIEPLSKV